MTFRAENPVIVQSDKTILLETHSAKFEEARDALSGFAELVKSPEHIHTYRVTPLSLWNAAALGWKPAEVDRAADFLHDPGISVLAPALAAAAAQTVSAMHDPTEGGIATGLLELATAAQVGLTVDLDAIPLSPLAAELCATFGLDPLGTIASGSLLAACAPEQVETLLAAWSRVGWGGRVIGQATADPAERTAYRRGRSVPFPTFAVDEITKLWT